MNLKILLFIFNFLLLYSIFAQPKVVVFYSIDCPMCIRETLTIRALQKKYNTFIFELVFSNVGTTQSQLTKYKEKYMLKNCILLLDSTKNIQKKYKAKVTPEVFLVSENNKIIYSGAINNGLNAKQQKKNLITENYLEDAITKYITKIPVEVKHKNAYGCLIE